MSNKEIKKVDIKGITKKKYEGTVYNFHLEGKSKNDKDDLFWVEQNTGVISHNCFPKDLGAFIGKCNDMGVDAKILEEIFDYNSRIRTVKDWHEIAGATVGGRDYSEEKNDDERKTP